MGVTAVRGGLPGKVINLEESTSQKRQTESDQRSSMYRAPAPHPAHTIPPPPTLSPTLASLLCAAHRTLGSSSSTCSLAPLVRVSVTQDVLQASRAHFLYLPTLGYRHLQSCADDFVCVLGIWTQVLTCFDTLRYYPSLDWSAFWILKSPFPQLASLSNPHTLQLDRINA